MKYLICSERKVGDQFSPELPVSCSYYPLCNPISWYSGWIHKVTANIAKSILRKKTEELLNNKVTLDVNMDKILNCPCQPISEPALSIGANGLAPLSCYTGLILHCITIQCMLQHHRK
jgi:hypothetical protein